MNLWALTEDEEEKHRAGSPRFAKSDQVGPFELQRVKKRQNRKKKQRKKKKKRRKIKLKKTRNEPPSTDAK